MQIRIDEKTFKDWEWMGHRISEWVKKYQNKYAPIEIRVRNLSAKEMDKECPARGMMRPPALYEYFYWNRERKDGWLEKLQQKVEEALEGEPVPALGCCRPEGNGRYLISLCGERIEKYNDKEKVLDFVLCHEIGHALMNYYTPKQLEFILRRFPNLRRVFEEAMVQYFAYKENGEEYPEDLVINQPLEYRNFLKLEQLGIPFIGLQEIIEMLGVLPKIEYIHRTIGRRTSHPLVLEEVRETIYVHRYYSWYHYTFQNREEYEKKVFFFLLRVASIILD